MASRRDATDANSLSTWTLITPPAATGRRNFGSHAFVRFSGAALREGVQRKKIEGVEVITRPALTASAVDVPDQPAVTQFMPADEETRTMVGSAGRRTRTAMGR